MVYFEKSILTAALPVSVLAAEHPRLVALVVLLAGVAVREELQVDRP